MASLLLSNCLFHAVAFQSNQINGFSRYITWYSMPVCYLYHGPPSMQWVGNAQGSGFDEIPLSHLAGVFFFLAIMFDRRELFECSLFDYILHEIIHKMTYSMMII